MVSPADPKPMTKSIIDRLAHALGRRDEMPNIELAEKISEQNDKASVLELVSCLQHKSVAVRNDAIKVLYEIGERKPDLIVGHYSDFMKALSHKDNRMKWGAMSALSCLSKTHPELLARDLTTIVKAMDEGSVITRDHGMYILANIGRLKKHHADCMELMLEQLERAPVNQMPMYAEKTAEIISKPYLSRFEKILSSRDDVNEIPSKQKRIEKLLKSLS